MTAGIIKVEVSVISWLHYGSADNTYQDLDYSGSQKITVLLYIVLKNITTITLSQGT